jgi:ER lumen protein retaining receptor
VVADIFWTLTDSLYNSTLKIVFLGSSAYTIYLMVNDYKPTHDPNVDTFKVEYLLGGSAILAILLPYRYTIPEVASPISSRGDSADHNRYSGHFRYGWKL